MYSAEEKIKWFAISSRIAVFLIQFVANYLIPDHDAGVFKKPRANSGNAFVEVLTSGLTRWDGQYFSHIAEYGYTYENTLAFFPLYPFLIRYVAYPFQILADNIFILTTHDVLVLTSVLVNNFLFTHSALLLYKLTLKVTSNERLSYASALLFCVNPASIFFSAAYSESLFCFLTLSGLVRLESGHVFSASFLFGLSSLTRSNGLINIGYIIYYQFIKAGGKYLKRGIISLACSLLACLPFIFYQVFCYFQYCEHSWKPTSNELIINHALRNGYIMPGNRSVWCEGTIPLAYSYIQEHYWNVGFLKYYETKQLPNFALAFPVLTLSVFSAFEFFRNHGKSLIRSGLMLEQKNPAGLSLACFPYVLHVFAMALFAALFMHVQVSTRFIFSSCPAIYWFCARIVVSGLCETREARIAMKRAKNPNMFYESVSNRNSKWKTFILNERFLGLALIVRYYHFSYFLAGSAIFANHLPWT